MNVDLFLRPGEARDECEGHLKLLIRAAVYASQSHDRDASGSLVIVAGPDRMVGASRQTAEVAALDALAARRVDAARSVEAPVAAEAAPGRAVAAFRSVEGLIDLRVIPGRSVSLARRPVETFDLGDAPGRTVGAGRGASESFAVGAETERGVSASRAPSEAARLTGTSRRTTSAARSTSETFDASASPARRASHPRQVTEGASVEAQVDRMVGASRFVVARPGAMLAVGGRTVEVSREAEAAAGAILDVALRAHSRSRQAQDAVGPMSAAGDRSTAVRRGVSGVLSFAELASRYADVARFSVDVVAVNARVGRIISNSRTTTVVVPPLDGAPLRAVEYPRRAFDAAPASAQPLRVVTAQRSTLDTARLTDAVARQVGYDRFASEDVPALDGETAFLVYVNQRLALIEVTVSGLSLSVDVVEGV